MTPEQEAYRDMWLAEMGAVVREYVAPIDPRKQGVDKPRDKPRKKAA